MLCPYCQTENRDDREACYHCSKDISMLRLIVNKAKHHYNQALEHAERGRTDEAITELKNALDLDSTMVNAHVVLGTLYAKKEQFDEAQKVWNQALALDHRYEKVHDYLNKSEPAKVVFPAVRRLKALSAMMGLVVIGLLLVLGITVLGQSRPSGDALAAELKDGNLDSVQTRNTLEEFMRRPGVHPEARQFAETLRKNIEQNWQEKLDIARVALSQNNPAVALQIIDTLEKERPDANVLNSIRRSRELAVQQLMQRLEDAAARFDEGTAQYVEVKPQALAVINLLPEGEQKTQASELLDRLQAQYRERVLAEAAATLNEAPLAEAVRRYNSWKVADPTLEAELTALLDRRLQRDTAERIADARQAIGAGDLHVAQEQLRAAQAIWQEAGRPVPDAELASVAAEVEQARRAQRIADLATAYAEERWDDFLQATENLDVLTTDTVERAKLETQRARAQRGFAQANWEWMEARDARFDSNSISPEDAARTVKIYEVTLETLPKSLNYARSAILFYAASAHLRLGQKEQAKALLERAQTEFPKQYGAKEARAFAKRFAKQLED